MKIWNIKMIAHVRKNMGTYRLWGESRCGCSRRSKLFWMTISSQSPGFIYPYFTCSALSILCLPVKVPRYPLIIFLKDWHPSIVCCQFHKCIRKWDHFWPTWLARGLYGRSFRVRIYGHITFKCLACHFRRWTWDWHPLTTQWGVRGGWGEASCLIFISSRHSRVILSLTKLHLMKLLYF